MKTLNTIMHGCSLNVALESNDVNGGLFTAMFSGSVTAKLTERVTTIFSFTKPSKLNQATAALNDWGHRNPYMTVTDLVVYRPPRMSVTYTTYIEALTDVMNAVNFIENDLFKPLFLVLGALVNDPSALLSKSMSVNKIARIPLLEKDIEVYIKQIADCLKDGSNSDTVKYKEVFGNNAQVGIANKLCEQLNQLVVDFDPEKVAKRVKDLFDLAHMLAEQVKLLGTPEKIKHLPAMKELSDILFQAARWIELAGLAVHGNLVVTKALNDTNEKLLKMAKK